MNEPSQRQTPYWVLISVLFSNVPLERELAIMLCDSARRLYRTKQPQEYLSGDLVTGKVKNLDTQAALGAIVGPVFEAELDIERGKAMVRFLLTREGIELAEAEDRAAAPVSHKPPVWN